MCVYRLSWLAFAAFVALAGCREEPAADAYGNFKADEVTVAAQSAGRLLRLSVREGDRVAAGEVVGLVDTTQAGIQRRALQAQRRSLLAARQATLAQDPEIAAQVGALRAELETAEEELARTRRLYEKQAATARELNQREGEAAVLRRRIEQALARSGAVREQAAGARAQAEQVEAQLREIDRQLDEARLTNPVAGMVLTVTAEPGETVQPGAPLYTIADTDTLTLRAYAAGAQLPALRLGMAVQVLVDAEGGGLQTLEGRVSWIAAAAQFTPTPIQTRDERAELVYAFDVRVPNPEGALKIGMPGEVQFPKAPARTRQPR